jgi:NAD(P)-dependent dehydrogenase (short-subunit alcohol dehydrogenase family)
VPAGSGHHHQYFQRQLAPCLAGLGVYGSAKAGLEKFARSLYLELRPHGVRVTTVVPSWGATGFCEAAQTGPLDREQYGKAIQPAEIGRLVADICALPPHLCNSPLASDPGGQSPLRHFQSKCTPYRSGEACFRFG